MVAMASGIVPSVAASRVPAVPGATVSPVAFSAIRGWPQADHSAVLQMLGRHCATPPALRAGRQPPAAFGRICREWAAVALDQAAVFFERNFQPYAITPDRSEGGFLTGYYEPEFPASLTRDRDHPVPLYGRPPDLISQDAAAPLPGWPAGFQAARRLQDGALTPYPDRQAIDEGALGPTPEVVAWMRDPVDRFVMQVQGSGRLRLPDGGVLRVAYAGRNGHPYTSLGRLMSQREHIPPAELTMDRLVARLKSDPDPNRSWIWANRSFVFFKAATELPPELGPIGGAGLPLTSHLSIAADRNIWPYGLPVWLTGTLPTQERGVDATLDRLTLIEDTGSAIVGPARFDLFWGSGSQAGYLAGLTRHRVDVIVLWPRDMAGNPG